jgi:hypothetical protein
LKISPVRGEKTHGFPVTCRFVVALYQFTIAVPFIHVADPYCPSMSPLDVFHESVALAAGMPHGLGIVDCDSLEKLHVVKTGSNTGNSSATRRREA